MANIQAFPTIAQTILDLSTRGETASPAPGPYSILGPVTATVARGQNFMCVVQLNACDPRPPPQFTRTKQERLRA